MEASLQRPDNLRAVKLPSVNYSESFEKLSAQRLLRLAIGQIFLAKSRADEVLTDETLSQGSKNSLCESIGRDLNGWFRIAADSAKNSTLGNLLQDCVTSTTDSQYHGQKWFLNQTNKDFTPDWQTFCDACVKQIMRASCLADGKFSQGNLAENGSFVAEYQLEDLSHSLRKEIVSLLQKWKINSDSKQAQLGLEWLVSDKDLESYLHRDSAIIFLHITDNQITGINITYSDIQISENNKKSIPSAGGSNAGTLWCSSKQVPVSNIMYDFLVATHRDLNSRGSYKSLLEATEQTASLLGKNYLLGGVRVENDLHPANSANDIHRHLGWSEEDYYFNSAATGARLRLISRQVREADCFDINSNHFLSPLNSPSRLIGNPRFLKDLSESGTTNAEQAYSKTTAYLEKHRMRHGFQIEEPQRTLSGGQQFLSIWKRNLQFTFFQAKSGLDLWYTNDSNEIRSFEECLKSSLNGYL